MRSAPVDLTPAAPESQAILLGTWGTTTVTNAGPVSNWTLLPMDHVLLPTRA